MTMPEKVLLNTPGSMPTSARDLTMLKRCTLSAWFARGAMRRDVSAVTRKTATAKTITGLIILYRLIREAFIAVTSESAPIRLNAVGMATRNDMGMVRTRKLGMT